ncbi:phosphoserine phosphatase RsbX [Robertmurraya siralis]|uniref:Phosphoserine phosphatase RsbX n=1 Tax=Robertmurraya siralis TaxID=77777 RepID=A0A919WK40_9BACI|nr:PP2C family serine/threonine-protein phosphatase [Robertmurraya siralis]PAE19852.1 phosphoserine phosphatase [Bacillus sp. 7504-2]GIN63521.1 phosphoserine phosphatase RsbX [Robertmurraya siralis]
MKHYVTGDVEVFAYQRTKEGNVQCGDDYFYLCTEDYFVCVLADGLGSGESAYESATAVVAIVKQYHNEDVETMMERCNAELAEKRGAAVAIFKVYFSKREFVYSCVGNIRFFLYSSSGKLTYPLPVTGYLSGRPQSFRTQNYAYEQYSTFLIYSDGFHFNGLKNLLNPIRSLSSIAEDIKNRPFPFADDATFIIGKLY